MDNQLSILSDKQLKRTRWEIKQELKQWSGAIGYTKSCKEYVRSLEHSLRRVEEEIERRKL